jgi:hypothetical protein
VTRDRSLLGPDSEFQLLVAAGFVAALLVASLGLSRARYDLVIVAAYAGLLFGALAYDRKGSQVGDRDE